MKIITWNCNMAFRKKADWILQYEPDILIIPECEHPEIHPIYQIMTRKSMQHLICTKIQASLITSIIVLPPMI
jgi:exonuclease III